MKAGGLLLLIAVVLMTGSCDSAGTAAPSFIEPVPTFSPSAAESADVYINFEHDSFVPACVTVPVGTTVIWQVAEDYTHHWVVCDAVPFRGWFYEWFPFIHVFTEPGTYPYYDGANPDITSLVIVY